MVAAGFFMGCGCHGRVLISAQGKAPDRGAAHSRRLCIPEFRRNRLVRHGTKHVACRSYRLRHTMIKGVTGWWCPVSVCDGRDGFTNTLNSNEYCAACGEALWRSGLKEGLHLFNVFLRCFDLLFCQSPYVRIPCVKVVQMLLHLCHACGVFLNEHLR